MPTKILNSYKPYVSCGTSANKGNPDKAGVSRAGGAAKIRSKTFPGVAKAMALQWGNLEGGVSMKKIKVAWIEQILEFDSVEEATGYRKSLETGRPQKFKILDERIIESGKVEIRIRKQYNNNAFPDD